MTTNYQWMSDTESGTTPSTQYTNSTPTNVRYEAPTGQRVVNWFTTSDRLSGNAGAVFSGEMVEEGAALEGTVTYAAYGAGTTNQACSITVTLICIDE